ncbi:MAG TPA: Lrp/AsnC family transcriptional regulator [Gaiellaceae bacterium]|nr:Lrp/AsnC family transcriptional regulator [Gaiellaceae bacterium]
MTGQSLLDRIDRTLVAALQENARLSNKELAERAGLAPSTCLERVRSLRGRGVIRGYHADVDPAALGRELEAVVAVRIRPHSRPVVDAFWAHVLELPETIEISHVSGADDFLVHIAVADTDALRDFILDGLTTRPEVAHLETHLVFARARKPALEPLGEPAPPLRRRLESQGSSAGG